MITWTRNLLGLLVSLLIVYAALYLAYRVPHTQPRGDGEEVVFGSQTSYVFFRPAAYVDGALTGMHFHVGPRPQP